VSLVTDHFERRGIAFEVVSHGQAYTSMAEAQALGIAAGEVVKTVVVHAASCPAGDSRVVGAHVYVDPEVMGHDSVVFAAGSQTESVKIRTEDLFGASR
jgi:prolyl-tRNA editing enzyme YbaK/EbsC (Cys-tRNA(Pro) deacylase)